MADYKAMYYHMFNKVSDVIEALKAVQVQTEAMYVDEEEPETTPSESDDAIKG